MAFYVPLGSRGVLFRVGTSLIGVIGGVGLLAGEPSTWHNRGDAGPDARRHDGADRTIQVVLIRIARGYRTAFGVPRVGPQPVRGGRFARVGDQPVAPRASQGATNSCNLYEMSGTTLCAESPGPSTSRESASSPSLASFR